MLLLSVCPHHQECIISQEEEVSLSAAALLYSVELWLWGYLSHGMASPLSDWCQADLAIQAQIASVTHKRTQKI